MATKVVRTNIEDLLLREMKEEDNKFLIAETNDDYIDDMIESAKSSIFDNPTDDIKDDNDDYLDDNIY